MNAGSLLSGHFFFFLAHFSACGPGVLVLVTKVFWHNIILLNSSRKRKRERALWDGISIWYGYNVMQDCRLMASRYNILCTDGEQPFIKTVIINQEMVSPWIDRITFTNQSDPNLKHQKSARQITFPLTSRHPQAKKKKKIWLWAYNSHVLVKSFTQ